MQKPKARKIASELSKADLARVVGGTAVIVRPPPVLPVNKRRRPVCCPG